jgi:hypothetical protein
MGMPHSPGISHLARLAPQEAPRRMNPKGCIAARSFCHGSTIPAQNSYFFFAEAFAFFF